MNLRRRRRRTKKKLVLLTGTAQPREDLRRLVAWHGPEQPEHLLRIASTKRLEQATQAWAKKFPEIGRRIAKTQPSERLQAMQKIETLGIRQVENALRKGFALKEVLNYPTRAELADFLRRTTPERVKMLKGFGLNEINARNLCALFESQGLEKIREFFAEMRRRNIDPNRLNPELYKEFYLTGKRGFLLSEKEQEKPKAREIGRARGLVFLDLRGKKRFIDFRRYGQSLFAKNYSFSNARQTALLSQGIRAFNFSGKLKRITSSNIFIGHGRFNREAFYLEVPEIADLIKEAKPKRQHLRNALAFADIATVPSTKNIHIYELQSDIVGTLKELNRAKYKNWAELTILGVADFAIKNGYDLLTFSSPHIIKQVWPPLGKELTQKLYYDLPERMGFQLGETKVKVQHYDSAFGKQHFGESNVFWWAHPTELRKKYNAFFK